MITPLFVVHSLRQDRCGYSGVVMTKLAGLLSIWQSLFESSTVRFTDHELRRYDTKLVLVKRATLCEIDVRTVTHGYTHTLTHTPELMLW
jgi:hypothetical protein